MEKLREVIRDGLRVCANAGIPGFRFAESAEQSAGDYCRTPHCANKPDTVKQWLGSLASWHDMACGNPALDL